MAKQENESKIFKTARKMSDLKDRAISYAENAKSDFAAGEAAAEEKKQK